MVSTHTFMTDREDPLERPNHGTKLIVKVERHLPAPDRNR